MRTTDATTRSPLPRGATPGRLALGALLALLALAAAACVGDVTTTDPDSRGIAVTGVGRVSVEPDVVIVDLGAEATGETVADARAETAAAIEAIRASLAANGVEDRDIRTSYLHIYPMFDYRDEEPELSGFTVSNGVEVRIRAIDDASAIVDEVIEAAGDAIRVGGIRFQVDDPAAHLDDARELAVADAASKAEQLANLAGVNVGVVLSISEVTGRGWSPAPTVVGAFDDGEALAATSIAPGEGEIAVSVVVVYAIE